MTRDEPIVAPYSSLLPLPRPYVVPGGRFRELYYWDSYFVMLGLAESGRRDLVQDMATNFADLIDTYGHAPNGTRTYYLSRSHPPFFFEMIGLLSPWDPAGAFARYLPELKTEYTFWMEGANGLKPGGGHRHAVALDDGSILNRYWDDSDAPRDESFFEDVMLAKATHRPPEEIYRDIRAGAESGWDFSSRWFADAKTMASIDTTEIIPVDLNALMFGLENAIRAGCEREGDHDCAEDYANTAAARRAAIDCYLWDPSRGAYLDYRWTMKRRTRPCHRRNPLSAVHARRRRGAGRRRWRRPSRYRTAASQAGSSRRRNSTHRTAVGLRRADGRHCRGGSAVVAGLTSYGLEPAGRDDRLPVDGQRLAGLSPRRANWWKNTTLFDREPGGPGAASIRRRTALAGPTA